MQSTTHLTDEEIIDQIKRIGNKDGFAILYKRYAHLLLGWSLRFLKDRTTSEDVVMDIMQQLMENIHKYQIKDFKNWLFLVTRNHCFMKLRGSTEVLMDDLTTINEEEFVENEEEVHLNIEHKENTLHEAIQNLKKPQRDCIVLFYFRKKSYKEIMEITGYEKTKVKSYIQNGKRNLKQALELTL